jgi:hypothetical protein
MMRVRRTRWHGGAHAPWAPFPLFLDDLQSLMLPDAADRLAIYPPLFSLQQVVALPVAKARIPLRERMNLRDQLRMVP